VHARAGDAGVIPLTPDDDCTALVAASPAGSTFLFAPGLYRLKQMLVARTGDTFLGDSAHPGDVILTGARLIAADLVTPTPTPGVYAAPNRTETEGTLPSHPCASGFSRCNFAQDLYVDGAPQLHVGSAAKVVAGCACFHFDYSNQQILFAPAEPTAAHVFELGVTRAAISSANSKPPAPDTAAGVTVANLTVRHFANPAQFGAVGDQYPGAGWVVSNVNATLNHGSGAKVHTGGRLLSSTFVRNGQMGAGSTGYGGGRGSDVEMGGCELAHNNYAGYSTGWEAGAGKFSSLDGAVLRDNYVHDNFGHGLWADVDGVNYTYHGNLVVNNTGPGIAHEISWAAAVVNNTLCFNGADQDTWLWGGQVQVQNSRGVEVRGNVAVVSGDFGNGIALLFQDRGNGTQGVYATLNATIVGNTVVVLGPQGGFGFTGGVANVATAQGVNTSLMFSSAAVDGNSYHFEAPDVHHKNATQRPLFQWAGNNRATWVDWQACGNDRGGSVHALVPGVVPAACYA